MSLAPYPVHLPPGSGASERSLDVVFAISGQPLPLDHALSLWEALLGRLPWVVGEPGVGVHAIRGSVCDGRLVLSRRTRLALRVPARRRDDAMRLEGQVLEVGGGQLAIGEARPRLLEPFPTLSAHFVATGEVDALAHQEAVEAMLARMGMPRRFICGRIRTLRAGGVPFTGAEVVLHELSPEDSLAMQERGLGGERHLGHGLFLPHKTIRDIA
ncbi:MAG: type I-MYXAN CRISPR-associated protein Cas6/Cmx6 [Anaerolineae bacterium]|nr:type I-MYXAN CRISPR-associated protein Cas6/Cmx6 [Anaerolineae bacterium]